MAKKLFLLMMSVMGLFLSGCMNGDEKLAAFFNGETFLQGRNTPGQLMTDRILDPSTAVLTKELLSGTSLQKKQARFELQRLKELIEFGMQWDLPRFQLHPPAVPKAPAIDGNIKFAEWQQKIELSGSCRAGRRRRYFDGSRLLLAYDKDMLYIAAYIPLASADKPGSITKDDHILLYFDMPGGSGKRYKECIITPSSRGLAASINWVYCGNGTREQLAKAPKEPEIKAAVLETKYGYSAEIAIPRSLLNVHPDGSMRFNLLYWDKTLRDYRSPVAFPYHGHDPFNRINVNLTPAIPAQKK